MKIGIISDIHENFHNLAQFFEQVEPYEIDEIFCLGDFINNGIAKMLAYAHVPVTAIWGNNDGEKVNIVKTAYAKDSNLSIGSMTYDILERDGRKIFLTHYPLIAKSMARSGDFDVVFYGHNHKKHSEYIADCLVLNPGEISAHKTKEASFAVYDTADNTAEIITIKDSINLMTDIAETYIRDMKFTFSASKTHKL